jgi:hypothetical protein
MGACLKKKEFFMKLLSQILVACLFSIGALADGYTISNGSSGREYLNCVGETKAGVPTRVKVAVEMGKGIVLKYFENEVVKSQNVVTKMSDARGVFFSGNPMSVLVTNKYVPNMPGPKRSVGAYQANLYSGNQSLGVIYCAIQ